MDATHFGRDELGGLGAIEIAHPPGTFAITPASRIAVDAIVRHQDRLAGTGVDWGSGTGCMAIVAARIPAVQFVIGLEIVAANCEVARRNAERNVVDHKIRFLTSDSWQPYDSAERAWFDAHAGRIDFVLANPPSSSPVGDGFRFRRVVLRGARRFLRPGGVVFLNVSEQYGQQRLLRLLRDAPGFRYDGLLATTDFVPFDMRRADLVVDVETYAAAEARGDPLYTFRDPADRERVIDARAALAHYRSTGESPLSRWQMHAFVYG
jgi:methylase of polypeptide subunit release factors